MNFDWFHATQVEESDNRALFFECKRRHFSIKNTTATRPRHKHLTGSTVLPLGLARPKEQPRLLQQLSRFYLLPFPRKKLGYLTTWTPHVNWKRCGKKRWFHILRSELLMSAGTENNQEKSQVKGSQCCSGYSNRNEATLSGRDALFWSPTRTERIFETVLSKTFSHFLNNYRYHDLNQIQQLGPTSYNQRIATLLKCSY